MKFELPTEKIKATRKNPRQMILFAKSKTGKTTALASLENCLIIDLESGAEFVDSMKLNIVDLAAQRNIEPIHMLKNVISELKKANKEKGDYVYKYGAVDTVSALERMIIPLANSMYKKTTMGRNWTGTSVLDLPSGAGYHYTREALSLVLNELGQCFDTLIISGHLKDKLVEKEGKEMTERGLNLAGKSASILCSQVDAVGYLYRDKNKTIVNFQPSESLICGSRSDHLNNKKITLIEEIDGVLKVDWSQIFLS